MSKTSGPAVSVILPVRDGAAYLALAAESILRQDWEDLELLAIDDGSRDDTPTILTKLAKADHRMRVIAGPAQGLVAALNRGLATARGRYVARMDADDVAHRNRISQQVALLEARPEVAVVGSAWRVVDPAGKLRRVVHPPLDSASIRHALLSRNPMGHPTIMFRREAVAAIGGYRSTFRLAEDFDLWLRISERHDLFNLAEPLLDYREHAGQSAWTDLEQRVFSELAAMAAAERRRAGWPDETDWPGVANLGLLERLGVGAQEIDTRMIGAALGATLDALSAGHPTAAREFARIALSRPNLRLRTRLHLWLLLVRAQCS